MSIEATEVEKRSITFYSIADVLRYRDRKTERPRYRNGLPANYPAIFEQSLAHRSHLMKGQDHE